MTRVAFFTYEFPPYVEGGAGVYAARLVPELVRLGLDVTVFTRRSSKRAGPGIRVRGISKPCWGAIGYWAAAPVAYLREVHQHGPFDIIHGNGVADLTVVSGAGSPLRVVTVHHLAAEVPSAGADLRKRLRSFRGEGGIVPIVERLVVKRADHLIAVSNETRAAIVRRFAVAEGRVTVIHHGVDQPLRRPSGLDHESLGLRQGVLLLSVGRLEYRKGPDVLLRAVARLVLHGHDVRVVLAGAGLKAEYEVLANELGIADRVTITGWVSEARKASLLELCDIYVVPSRLEGFGMTALEAMAAGKPVVSTPIGASRDGLVDEGCGGLAEAATPEAVAAAIERCIGRLRKGERLGARNRARAAESSWERAGRSTEKVYEYLISTAVGGETPRSVRS
jgi:glycosyltransferase involved in cell wall biosynthesis